MKKKYLLIVFFLLGIGSIEAQITWYENATKTTNLVLGTVSKGTFTANATNPETIGINTNTTASKFVTNGQTSPTVLFELPKPITDLSTYTISFKVYTSIKTADFNTQNKRIRLYLKNSSTGTLFYKQLSFTAGETWETFSFNLDGTVIPTDVALNGGYDQILIGFASGDTTGLISTYYIDTITGTTSQLIANAAFLSGSWGVRFNMPGGFNLDNDSADGWVANAQQIVTDLPAVGHVVTNLTHAAQGYFYTLRDNPYVDVANEIHPAMVPTLENEKIILDVINVFKNSGKKVILYLNGGGPGHLQGDRVVEQEILAAWKAYYKLKYNGDEALAWRTLAKGYVERFKGLVDGYWLDNLDSLPGEISDFVAMIKEVDPNVAISTNGEADSVMDENGQIIYVDSDGINDTDPTDYKIKNFTISDPYLDFTGGHPTPLGQGAPPNSWAYEEFLFPLIVAEPWGTYDGRKQGLKHYFCPIREKWSVARSALVFEKEQAYRFVRTFTDAGAAITWSTTITNGGISPDEMSIMREVSNRMMQSPKPDYIPYTRPEGAYLVGETLSVKSNILEENSLVLFPNPVVQSFQLSKEISSAILYDLSGQKILEFNSNQTSYDVSGLIDGIYLLRTISITGERHLFKIIKK